MQPSRRELKEFYELADPLLDYKRFWADAAKKQALGDVFGGRRGTGYTVWACAVLSNHVHLVIRRHRDDALTMWHRFADATRLRLREFPEVENNHPVWSERPYKVFLSTPEAVRSCIGYVESNPEKEGLPPQEFEFVQVYNNWPFHKKR